VIIRTIKIRSFYFMKNKILPLIAISLVTLTSCKFFNLNISHPEGIDVYNLDRFTSGEDIENAYDTTINARFKDSEPLIPYLTLKDYAALYASHFDTDVTSNYSKSPLSVSWSVYRGEALYFLTEIDFSTKQIVMAGSLQAAFKAGDSPKDLTALNYGASVKYDDKYLSGNGFSYYSFSDFAIKYFSYNNNYYFSLGFLDMSFSSQSGIYFYYNYSRIVSSEEVDNFSSIEYMVNDVKKTVESEMKEVADNELVMPSYLRQYNANLFLYFLDNFYGLKEEKGIKSAINYTKKIGTYNDLFAIDSYTRVQAIADSLSYLDDNHTALISGSSAWDESSFTRWRYGNGVKARSQLNAKLTSKRASVYTEKGLSNPGAGVLYSNDGKTAMYAFDGFVFGTSAQVFNQDGTIKDGAYNYDTFINLITKFTEIKNKGGVENVVLDISLNGGGTVGVLMKILSLVSKNNTSDIHYYEKDTQELAIATTEIDINSDKQYNLDDCFGDDFNIFIMTSDCSFSAANAFACSASCEGICKIIGQKSGGGECAVGIHYLPNGEYLYHSSSLHLGYYNESNDEFIGFEGGAEPEFKINDINQMYDIEYLNENLVNYI